MKRVLILASVASMIDQFNMPNIKLLQEMGYAVDVACNFKDGNTCSDERVEDLKRRLKKSGVRCYQIDFARDITNIGRNVRAFWQVEHLLEKNSYTFLHCHSPIGGVVGRLAGKKTHTKVIYTAHGFHFYKGAPLKNWMIYYPVEKICSYMTDVLICINKEDYALAKKKMNAKKIEYLPGVGIDLDKFGGGIVNHKAKRDEIGIPDGKLWILAVGELIERKNHKNLIRAMVGIDEAYLTIAGQGELKGELEKLIYDLRLENKVKLLGFHTDISELYNAVDVFAFPSYHEEMPLALMEAMASRKPIVCSKTCGNTDLLDEGKGGYYFEPDKPDEIVDAIKKMKDSDMQKMGCYNYNKMRCYDLLGMLRQDENIYQHAAAGEVFHLAKIINRQELRESIGVSLNDTLLLSVGELNENKNHSVVIKALGEMNQNNKGQNLQYAIAGHGKLETELKQLAERYGIASSVHFLGYRDDVVGWYQAADVFVHPSKREGLSVSLMEAMACELPIICSKIRGNVDLIDDDGGIIVDRNSSCSYADAILCLKDDLYKRAEMGIRNKNVISKYGIAEVCLRMMEIISLERGIKK